MRNKHFPPYHMICQSMQTLGNFQHTLLGGREYVNAVHSLLVYFHHICFFLIQIFMTRVKEVAVG